MQEPSPATIAPDDVRASAPREDVAAWARRTQREKEAALDAEGRIRLALRLGLRARALATLVRR